jgi:hypothetical protein
VPSFSGSRVPRGIVVQNDKVHLWVWKEKELSVWQTNGSGHDMH